jgi:uncharacterized protein (TIGR02145 family)
MKKIFATLASVVLTACLFAQAPQKMSYQAIVRDSNDKLVINQVVGMQISILRDSPTEGKVVYTETQTVETNANGLVSINIGGKEGFENIAWANGEYYVKTEIDLKGGTNYTITGTYQILSVPFAFHAETATDAVNLTGNQTISGNKTFSGTIAVPTPVNEADATTKAYVDVLMERIKMLEGEIVKDYDGNVYPVVRIGNSLWMAENLKTTHFNDGTDIPLVTDDYAWSHAVTSPAYCWYSNDESSYKNTYGALYNWNAIFNGKLCPAGWNVASDSGWDGLEDYLINNGYNYDGTLNMNEKKLAKALASNSGWNSSSVEGAVGNSDYPAKRNATGFTALPGGYRHANGSFSDIGNSSLWWTTSYEISQPFAHFRGLYFDSSYVTIFYNSILYGYSIRCSRSY